jgi:hypothetical protein
MPALNDRASTSRDRSRPRVSAGAPTDGPERQLDSVAPSANGIAERAERRFDSLVVVWRNGIFEYKALARFAVFAERGHPIEVVLGDSERLAPSLRGPPCRDVVRNPERGGRHSIRLGERPSADLGAQSHAVERPSVQRAQPCDRSLKCAYLEKRPSLDRMACRRRDEGAAEDARADDGSACNANHANESAPDTSTRQSRRRGE